MNFFRKIKKKLLTLVDILSIKLGLYTEIKGVFLALRKDVKDSNLIQVKYLDTKKARKLGADLNLKLVAEISEVEKKAKVVSNTIKEFYLKANGKILDLLDKYETYDSKHCNEPLTTVKINSRTTVEDTVDIEHKPKQHPLYNTIYITPPFLTPTKKELLSLIDLILKDLDEINRLMTENNKLYVLLNSTREELSYEYFVWYYNEERKVRNNLCNINFFYLNMYKYVKLFLEC
jgi:hypothetical protein